MRRHAVLLLVLWLSTWFVVSACEGCRAPGAASPDAAAAGKPTARLYLVSDLAGALEPCGCVKDQLGGMDHFGALVAAGREAAKGSAVLSAGALFFMDMDLEGERRSQELAKAETIARCLARAGLVGFAPARNDWALGADALARLRDTSGAALLAANVAAAPGRAAFVVRDVGGLKVGFVGVAAPDQAKRARGALDGVTSTAPADAVREAAEAAKKEGAQAIVVAAAVGRGEAKRIADVNPELLAIVVGSAGASGEVNTQPAPAERIGDVLVVETGNHLQTVAELDLFVRDAPATGLVAFADATGIDRVRKREELGARVDELRAKIATWEKDRSVDPKDVEARKADVARLEAERAALEASPPPPSGSFYRYAMRDIREQLGADEAIKEQMLAYYAKVNEANKAAFADKKPPPPAKGEPGYVGIEVCSTCHEEPRQVWDGTAHAHAYETLAKQHKEFNLDCVSCHVTGYDKPGGSTVTHVDDLKGVQCEVCHGPGQNHAKAKAPEKVAVPIPKPGPDACTTCHHPPHVHTFDARAKMADVLGPGHGKPLAP